MSIDDKKVQVKEDRGILQIKTKQDHPRLGIKPTRELLLKIIRAQKEGRYGKL